MNKEAFLKGYLYKEAYGVSDWWEDTKRGVKTLSPSGMSDLYQGAKAGIRHTAEDVKHSVLDKVLPGQLGTRQGRAQASKFLKGPEQYIAGKLKPHMAKARKDIGDAFKASTATGAATTLATGLMTNMAAQGRHKQLMQALRSRRSPAQAASPSPVFRLSTPAARARQGN